MKNDVRSEDNVTESTQLKKFTPFILCSSVE